jgi:hypothetical protein
MIRLILLLLFVISTVIFVFSLTTASNLAPVPPSARPSPAPTSTGAQSIPPPTTSDSWDWVQIMSGLTSFVTLIGLLGTTWTNWRRGQIRLEQDRIELERRKLELERLKRDK